MNVVQANILDPKVEAKRKYARERARRLRQDPEYRALELERNRKWREDNPEKIKAIRSESHRKWYVEHRDEKLAKNKDWKVANPDKVIEMARQQRAKNPDKCKEATARCERKRRAIKLERFVGNLIELSEYEALLMCDPCSYCGEPMRHVDHIDSLSGGGTHEWMNLTAACGSCNRRKYTKTLLEFMLCS